MSQRAILASVYLQCFVCGFLCWVQGARNIGSRSMSEFSSRSTAISVHDHKRNMPSGTHPVPTEFARGERVWVWLLRFVLPATLGLCVQLDIWLWFNTPYPPDAWSICGGAVLAGVALLLAIWTWHSWLPFDRSERSRRCAEPRASQCSRSNHALYSSQ